MSRFRKFIVPASCVGGLALAEICVNWYIDHRTMPISTVAQIKLQNECIKVNQQLYKESMAQFREVISQQNLHHKQSLTDDAVAQLLRSIFGKLNISTKMKPLSDLIDEDGISENQTDETEFMTMTIEKQEWIKTQIDNLSSIGKSNQPLELKLLHMYDKYCQLIDIVNSTYSNYLRTASHQTNAALLTEDIQSEVQILKYFLNFVFSSSLLLYFRRSSDTKFTQQSLHYFLLNKFPSNSLRIGSFVGCTIFAMIYAISLVNLRINKFMIELIDTSDTSNPIKSFVKVFPSSFHPWLRTYVKHSQLPGYKENEIEVPPDIWHYRPGELLSDPFTHKRIMMENIQTVADTVLFPWMMYSTLLCNFSMLSSAIITTCIYHMYSIMQGHPNFNTSFQQKLANQLIFIISPFKLLALDLVFILNLTSRYLVLFEESFLGFCPINKSVEPYIHYLFGKDQLLEVNVVDDSNVSLIGSIYRRAIFAPIYFEESAEVNSTIDILVKALINYPTKVFDTELIDVLTNSLKAFRFENGENISIDDFLNFSRALFATANRMSQKKSNVDYSERSISELIREARDNTDSLRRLNLLGHYNMITRINEKLIRQISNGKQKLDIVDVRECLQKLLVILQFQYPELHVNDIIKPYFMNDVLRWTRFCMNSQTMSIEQKVIDDKYFEDIADLLQFSFEEILRTSNTSYQTYLEGDFPKMFQFYPGTPILENEKRHLMKIIETVVMKEVNRQLVAESNMLGIAIVPRNFDYFIKEQETYLKAKKRNINSDNIKTLNENWRKFFLKYSGTKIKRYNESFERYENYRRNFTTTK